MKECMRARRLGAAPRGVRGAGERARHTRTRAAEPLGREHAHRKLGHRDAGLAQDTKIISCKKRLGTNCVCESPWNFPAALF